jgi:hypothetical protein
MLVKKIENPLPVDQYDNYLKCNNPWGEIGRK